MRKVSLLCLSTCLLLPGLTQAAPGPGPYTPPPRPTAPAAATNALTNTTTNTNTNTNDASKKGKAKTTTTSTPEVTPDYFKFYGYVEGSYNYLANEPKFISGTQDRVFDIEPDGLTLQQAAITLSRQPTEGLGALVNLIAGRDASTIAAYGFLPQSVGFDITQLYVQYTINPVTVLAGKFISIAGYETIDPTLDPNFSRSILFGYAVPSTLLGFRGIYTANNKLAFIAGVNDGWDNIEDMSRRKTIELGVKYKYNPKISFSAAAYNGAERAISYTSSGPIGTRTLFDFVATYKKNDKLSFAGNYDFAWQTVAILSNGEFGRATWQGLALYGIYKFNNKWDSVLRGEVFKDQNGARTGVRQNWEELTLTLGYTPIKNLLIRAELRHDFSSASAYLDKNGIQLHNSQQSYALEASYKV